MKLIAIGCPIDFLFFNLLASSILYQNGYHCREKKNRVPLACPEDDLPYSL